MADSRFVDGVIGVQSECLFRGFRRVNRHGLGIKLTLGPTPGFGLEEFFYKNRLGISPRICSIKTKEDSVRVSVRRFFGDFHSINVDFKWETAKSCQYGSFDFYYSNLFLEWILQAQSGFFKIRSISGDQDE